MERNSTEVNSVTDYLQKVKNCEKFCQKLSKEKIECYRNNFQENSGLQEALHYYEEHQTCPILYRGHSDEHYELIPSAYREGRKGNHYFYNEARRICPEEFHSDNVFENLSKMQHYGIPTTLLDVTTNPLVALFFACCSKEDKDGMVYSFPALPISEDNIVVKRLSKFAILSDDEQKAISKDEMYLEHLFVVRPCCVDDRMIRQQGYFILCAQKDERVSQACDYTFRICQSDKNKLVKELDKLGINEFSLFGDLDHLGKYLCRK